MIIDRNHKRRLIYLLERAANEIPAYMNGGNDRLLDAINKEITLLRNAHNRQQSVVTQDPQAGKDNEHHSEVPGDRDSG